MLMIKKKAMADTRLIDIIADSLCGNHGFWNMAGSEPGTSK